MASILKVDKLDPQSGTALEIGTSGDTITIPSGATIVNSGTATGFGITQSSFVPTAAPLIINGNMAVAQRGTSFAAIGDGEYTLDRFETNKAMDAVATITQETLTSGNAYADGFKNAFKVDVTTADASLTGTQRLLIQQGIEAQDLQVLKFGTANAEKLTLSFWIKATKTGTNIVRLYAPDDNRAVSASYTVDSTDTWEKKVLNFPADTTGVIDDDNGAGIQVAWCIGAGPDFQSGTLATTWGTQTAANDFVGQVNNLDSTSNNFHITGVQFEVGEYTSSDLPPFRHESYGDNLQRCQRYFQTIADGSWSSNETISNGYFHVGSSFFFTLRLAVEMRANPSLTTTMGTNYVNIYRDNGSDQSDNIETYSGSTKRAMGLKADDNVSGTQGQGGQIGLNNASAFFGVNAEL
jgi:hypothetical protein